MKKNIFADFLKRIKFQKRHPHIFKDSTLAEEKTPVQAKIIKLYKKDVPVIRQAKVVSLFSRLVS